MVRGSMAREPGRSSASNEQVPSAAEAFGSSDFFSGVSQTRQISNSTHIETPCSVDVLTTPCQTPLRRQGRNLETSMLH